MLAGTWNSPTKNAVTVQQMLQAAGGTNVNICTKNTKHQNIIFWTKKIKILCRNVKRAKHAFKPHNQESKQQRYIV